jgi:hypothetical protein
MSDEQRRVADHPEKLRHETDDTLKERASVVSYIRKIAPDYSERYGGEEAMLSLANDIEAGKHI